MSTLVKAVLAAHLPVLREGKAGFTPDWGQT